MQRYEHYKNSGIEWLGEIPEHWEVSKIKYDFYLKGRVGWKGLQSSEFEVESYAYLVTGVDFKSKYIAWDKCYQINKYRYEDDPFIQLKEGDLLITKDGTIGKLAFVKDLNKPACLNSGIFLLRPISDSICSEYIYWILKSMIFIKFFELTSFGSTILHLYQNVFENFSFPLPPLAEQTAIANFLDTKCEQIDRAVAQKERVIELLNERRQTVIQRAVTRGLNPDVPLRDSGIDWIGEIPAHWEVKALKHISKLESGETISPDQFIDYEGYPVYGGNGFRGFTSTYTNDGYFALIGRQGALCGNVNYASGKFYASEHAIVVYPLKNENTYWLGELIKVANLNRLSQSAAQPGIAVNVVKNLLFPYPPLAEQNEIANYLDTVNEKIDRAVALKRKEVENLKEYKQTLINSAVTGKIKIA